MSEETAPAPGGDPPRPDDAPPSPRALALHLGLFLATFLTTTWVGIVAHPRGLETLAHEGVRAAFPLGLSYSLSLMAILLTHEMGHFVMARRRGVRASLPYFIPLPLPPVGTLGAVIRMRGRVASRDALMDIGAAGPLAGLVVAIPILAYGLYLSPVHGAAPGSLQEGNSILYAALKLAVKGEILPAGGRDVFLHPMAWAGWVGLLVTMLNLVPVGQLDGGHIAHALFGRRSERISAWLHRGLLLLAVLASGYTILLFSREGPLPAAAAQGWSAGFPWVIWWVMLALLKRLSGGRYHPPVGDEPLTPGRRRLCIAMLVLFVLLLPPVPLRATWLPPAGG